MTSKNETRLAVNLGLMSMSTHEPEIQPTAEDLAHAASIGMRILGIRGNVIRICPINDMTSLGHTYYSDFLMIHPPFKRSMMSSAGWVVVDDDYYPLGKK